jgi:hypothetical protein
MSKAGALRGQFDYVTKVRSNIAFFVVVALSAIVFLTGGFATQKAYAVGGTFNQPLCESFPGPGVWSVNTCTITSAITIVFLLIHAVSP